MLTLPRIFCVLSAAVSIALELHSASPGRRAAGWRRAEQREVRSVQLTVKSVRAGDPSLLQTAMTLPEIILYRAGSSPFQVDLSLEKAPSRIDVSAEYRVTPDVSAPDSAGPQGTLNAEDACAASKHPYPSYRR